MVKTEGSELTEAGADRLLQVEGRRLQGAVLGRVPRGAGPHSDREAAEVQAAGAVLGGPRPAGQLILGAHPGRAATSWPRVACPALAEVTRCSSVVPPHRADDWDAVGLVLGDPAADVRRILLAVDPVAAVADEAVASTPTCSSATTRCSSRGARRRGDRSEGPGRAPAADATVARLFTAHTNADSPAGGRLRVAGVRARPAATSGRSRPTRRRPLDKIVVFVPVDDAERVRAAWPAAGAGAIGDYDSASFTCAGEGRFRPAAGRRPAIGAVGELETVEEVRIETVLPARSATAVVAAMLAAHPYEEPAYDVIELAARDDPTAAPAGSGDCRADDPARVRGAGRAVASRDRPRRPCRRGPGRGGETVALCGGAGDFLLDRARAAGVDVYVTSDLRHHPASELREHGRPGAGRRRALGGGVDLAAGAPERLRRGAGRYGGGARQHDQHRPVDLPGLNPTAEEHPLKADPFAQLKLLDVQELDSRARPPAPPAEQRSPRPRAASSSGRRDRRRRRGARPADRGRRPRPRSSAADADVEQVKTRRERDQRDDRRRPDRRPEGAPADARRARVAATGGSPTSRTSRSR